MNNVIIRIATINDVIGIQNIHRTCKDPWHDYEECKDWIEKRLERDFHILVAVLNGKIIGHGEWIISQEPTEKFLYLGMLQIDRDFQKMGIGRKMIDAGIVYGRNNNCSKMVTIPEIDNNSIVFYEKCGFIKERTIHKTSIPTKDEKYEFDIINSIPENVISKLEFIFGLSQISSRHMWEVLNRKPNTDDRLTPAIKINNNYLQLSYYKNQESALVLYWGNRPNKDIIDVSLNFGYQCGLKTLDFVFFDEFKKTFENVEIYGNDIELCLYIN